MRLSEIMESRLTAVNVLGALELHSGDVEAAAQELGIDAETLQHFIDENQDHEKFTKHARPELPHVMIYHGRGRHDDKLGYMFAARHDGKIGILLGKSWQGGVVSPKKRICRVRVGNEEATISKFFVRPIPK